jgi:hypothetical protein
MPVHFANLFESAAVRGIVHQQVHSQGRLPDSLFNRAIMKGTKDRRIESTIPIGPFAGQALPSSEVCHDRSELAIPGAACRIVCRRSRDRFGEQGSVRGRGRQSDAGPVLAATPSPHADRIRASHGSSRLFDGTPRRAGRSVRGQYASHWPNALREIVKRGHPIGLVSQNDRDTGLRVAPGQQPGFTT